MDIYLASQLALSREKDDYRYRIRRTVNPITYVYTLRKTKKKKKNSAKQAIVNITIALSNDLIQILKLWCAESDEFDHIHYMDRVAHNNYKTHQYFVYVDDIGSVSSSQHRHSLEFVQSSNIYSTFA